MRALRHWLPFAAWAALIWWASSRAGDTLPPLVEIPGIDKVVHFCEFGLLALLLQRALLHGGPALAPAAALALAILFALGYGVLDEWHQSTTAGRDSSPWDAVADVAGATAFTLAYHFRRSRPTRGAPR